jgi:hypothetical protein
VTSTEDRARAAMRAIGGTVQGAPPLRLDPAPGESRSAGRWARRTWRRGNSPRIRSWLAPVAAAAVVVAVAVTLVLVRGPQNDGVVPPPALTNFGPGGVPRYYVAVEPGTGSGDSPNGLLAGDTVTGQTIPVKPPPHMSFRSVTAAADDRTFFAFASQAGGTGTTGLWFALVLAPGTQNMVTLASTAIAQQSGVAASALSASGKYLAVAERGPAAGQQRVVVFAVDTGRPLDVWSTKTAPAIWLAESVQQNLLTWIDGDRAIALSGYAAATGQASVRRLSFPLPSGHGDLIADSQLIWSPPASTQLACALSPLVVSVDGPSIACAATSIQVPQKLSGGEQWTTSWRVYQASVRDPASNKYTIAYQVTKQLQANVIAQSQVLWASPSGSAVLGAWATAPIPSVSPSPSSGNGPSTGTGTGSGSGTSTAPMVLVSGVLPGAVVHVGVMSHGTFTPLQLPRDILFLPNGGIAW